MTSFRRPTILKRPISFLLVVVVYIKVTDFKSIDFTCASICHFVFNSVLVFFFRKLSVKESETGNSFIIIFIYTSTTFVFYVWKCSIMKNSYSQNYRWFGINAGREIFFIFLKSLGDVCRRSYRCVASAIQFFLLQVTVNISIYWPQYKFLVSSLIRNSSHEGQQ